MYVSNEIKAKAQNSIIQIEIRSFGRLNGWALVININ